MSPLRLLAAAAVLAAAVPPAAAGPISDPAGDTFGLGPVFIDIRSVAADLNLGTGRVEFSVTFFGPVSPVTLGNPDSVRAVFDIDVDRNPLTGQVPLMTQLGVPGPAINLGAELFIDTASEFFYGGGLIDVTDAATFNTVATVPIQYTATGFSFSVPASVFAGLPGGSALFNYGVAAGTLGEPTDRAPNGAQPFVVTPEPGTLAVFGLLGLGGLLARRRIRT